MPRVEANRGDPAVSIAREAVEHLLMVRGRLPLLRAIWGEMRALGRAGAVLRNVSVLQLVRDCGNMLVIDLASLREGTTESDGLFNLLRLHLDRLRRFRARDFRDQAVGLRSRSARALNRIFTFLFPGGEPVTPDHVRQLTKRFLQETKPTDRDRNRVRAHRFEGASRDSGQYFQTIDKVEKQIGIFWRYLHGLYVVLARGDFAIPRPELEVDRHAATDIVDLIAVGSIDQAVLRYGLVPTELPQGARPPIFYWEFREEFFRNGGRLDPD